MALASHRSVANAEEEEHFRVAEALSESHKTTEFPALPSSSKGNHDGMEGVEERLAVQPNMTTS